MRRHLRTAQLPGAFTPPDGAEDMLVVTNDPGRVAGASIVIECVTEAVEPKRQALADASRRAASDAVLLSNTSAIPIDELADALVEPQRLVGAHFMNPPYLIDGVELVRGPRSAPAAMSAAQAMLGRLGRPR